MQTCRAWLKESNKRRLGACICCWNQSTPDGSAVYHLNTERFAVNKPRHFDPDLFEPAPVCFAFFNQQPGNFGIMLKVGFGVLLNFKVDHFFDQSYQSITVHIFYILWIDIVPAENAGSFSKYQASASERRREGRVTSQGAN
jgi:hypothetical protein